MPEEKIYEDSPQGLLAERNDLLAERNELREQLAIKEQDFQKATKLSEDRQTTVEEQNQLIAKYDNRNRELRQERDEVIQSRDDLSEQLERMTDVHAELSQQIEEMSVSPLDLTQQQRAKALTLAREVVEETGSAGVFTRQASSKVSMAGVLSTAHFITSGGRDYVTGEGEFIEWHALAPRRPAPEQLVGSTPTPAPMDSEDQHDD